MGKSVAAIVHPKTIAMPSGWWIAPGLI